MTLPTWLLFVLLLVMNTLHVVVGMKILPDGSAWWITCSLVMSAIANALAIAGNPILPHLSINKVATLLLLVVMNALHGVVGFKVLRDGSGAWIGCSVALAFVQNALVLLGEPLTGGPDKPGLR